jgi:hypothetical protein
MFCPFTWILPLLASVNRLIIRSMVDFPAPDGPMTPTICGFSMEKETE